nr:MAG TPA: deoxyuridine 5'-triphosphate nucleotidohydrolase [Bacteriophage sp.]
MQKVMKIKLDNGAKMPKKAHATEDKITQIMFIPYITAFFKVEDTLDETERGDGGFGSTGK